VPLDLDAASRQHHAPLLRSLRAQVPTARSELVEDAASSAWSQAARYRLSEETAFAWLLTVAIREARRTHRRALRDAERYVPLGRGAEQADRGGCPQVRAEFWTALGRLRPPPQLVHIQLPAPSAPTPRARYGDGRS
jgi:hypothetical protein